jgi:hypothetical protein
MSVLDVQYAEVVRDPTTSALKAAAFLGGMLDVSKMAGTVEHGRIHLG